MAEEEEALVFLLEMVVAVLIQFFLLSLLLEEVEEDEVGLMAMVLLGVLAVVEHKMALAVLVILLLSLLLKEMLGVLHQYKTQALVPVAAVEQVPEVELVQIL